MKATHRMSTTPTYNSWRGMIERCTNPNNSHYPYYGGKNITVCSQWFDFELFLIDMGERPEGYSLDRIDNDGDYTPENCRWATPSDQARNRTDNIWIDWEGERKILADWAAKIGVTPRALAIRIERWGLEKAMTTVKLKNGDQKLTDEQVLHARTMRAKLGVRYGGVQLAKQYGVTESALHRAVRGLSFKHLPTVQSIRRNMND